MDMHMGLRPCAVASSLQYSDVRAKPRPLTTPPPCLSGDDGRREARPLLPPLPTLLPPTLLPLARLPGRGIGETLPPLGGTPIRAFPVRHSPKSLRDSSSSLARS